MSLFGKTVECLLCSPAFNNHTASLSPVLLSYCRSNLKTRILIILILILVLLLLRYRIHSLVLQLLAEWIPAATRRFCASVQ